MESFLKIENIKLWARVGVLDVERELGQMFTLDIFLWTDFEKCTVSDDIKKTVDYSKLVQILKKGGSPPMQRGSVLKPSIQNLPKL